MNEKILAHINTEESLQLLSRMIQINTVNEPGNELPLAVMIADHMRSFGMEVEVIDLGNNRGNVIGRIRGTGERDALMFNGHLDTVPPGDVEWLYSPYSGLVKEGKVYGRGAADMKGGLAAMLTAAEAIKKSGVTLKGDLIFAMTAGEEVDSVGAIHLLNNGGLKGVGAIVVGEPSSCGINIAEKGTCWLSITTYGKTAHGAFPKQGINAITNMNVLINKLSAYQFRYVENHTLGHPTMNIATIKGGVKTNVVPDKCTLTVDIRTVPGMSHGQIVEDFENLIAELENQIAGFKATVSVLNNRPAVETVADHPFVTMSQAVIQDEFNKRVEPKGVNFYTDAAIFLPSTNLPAILYGPGDAEMAHQPNESVSVDRMAEAITFYAAIIERYLVL